MFKQTKINLKELHQVILAHTLQWCLANDWLVSSQKQSWSCHPQGAFLQTYCNIKKKLWNYIHSKSDLVATTDGSWIPGTSIGGLGGLIRSRNKKICLLFNGPSHCYATIDAEIESLKVVLRL